MIAHASGRMNAAASLLRRALRTNPYFSVMHGATARDTLEHAQMALAEGASHVD